MWHETPIDIRYADTDQMGVVHHATYPIYCEIGRTHLMASKGLPYHQLESSGIFLMVVEMTCRYRAPCRYGDHVSVLTRIAELKRKLLSFEYQIIHHQSKAILFTGSTKHLFSQGTRSAIRCPDSYWEILSKIHSG